MNGASGYKDQYNISNVVYSQKYSVFTWIDSINELMSVLLHVKTA